MKQKVYRVKYQGKAYNLCVRVCDDVKAIAYKLLGISNVMMFFNNYNLNITATNISPNGFELNKLVEVI